MTISGNGFVTSNPENNDISVCGVLSGLEQGVHKIELRANNSEEFRLKILDVGVSYL